MIPPDLNGVNEYGVPLHACHGHRCDEHYWAWIGMRVARGDFGAVLRMVRRRRMRDDA